MNAVSPTVRGRHRALRVGPGVAAQRLEDVPQPLGGDPRRVDPLDVVGSAHGVEGGEELAELPPDHVGEGRGERRAAGRRTAARG